MNFRRTTLYFHDAEVDDLAWAVYGAINAYARIGRERDAATSDASSILEYRCARLIRDEMISLAAAVIDTSLYGARIINIFLLPNSASHII